MTVEELIEKLRQVENQKLPVRVYIGRIMDEDGKADTYFPDVEDMDVCGDCIELNVK